MKIPIANSMGSISYYKNIDNKFVFNDKFFQKLNFFRVKKETFPSIKILLMNKILNETGYIVINSLNEILVDKFIKNQILFTDITHKLLTILKSSTVKNHLKRHKIRYIKDVFITYKFCKKLLAS
jgi:1-deoxy-D-xylulose 5-phosphate reductoisomerase